MTAVRNPALTPRGSADAASALAEFIGVRAQAIERAGRLPDEVAGALRGSGLLRLLMPRVLGGAGGDWQSAFAAIETVARSDGSTAWSLMIGMTINMLAGYIDRDEAIELFAGQDPLFIAGVFEPRGLGESERGGAAYRVSGRWRFATGVHLSDWFCATAAVRDGLKQEVRHFFVPTASVKIHPDWNVIGLAGTGSDDAEIDAAVIGRNRSFTFDYVPWPEEPFWRVSFYTVTASLMAAAVLGIARGGLDQLIARKASSGPSVHRFGRSALESNIATAEGMVRAARAFVIECIDDIATSTRTGATPSERQRAALWLASIHAARSCSGALDLLYDLEGASGIRQDSPLQRSWRDVRAAAKHVVIAHSRLEAIGRVLLGSPSDAKPFL